MILFDTSESMNWSSDPLDPTPNTVAAGVKTRLQLAKDTLTSLLTETKNVRFCLSTFDWHGYGSSLSFSNQYGGAKMDSNMLCGTALTTLKSKINSLTATGGTPLASALYDVTRYFRGKSAYFGDFDFTSPPHPVRYRCQANTVVVISDGEASGDWNISSSGFTPPYILNKEDRTIDGVSYSFDVDNWTSDSDPDSLSAPVAKNVFDDLALFANQIKITPPSSGDTDLDDIAQTSALADTDPLNNGGYDEAGVAYDDDVAHIETRKIQIHVIGLLIEYAMLVTAANNGKGKFSEATNQDELLQALRDVVGSSTSGTDITGAGAAQTSTSLIGGKTTVFVTEYDTSDWSGDLTKNELSEGSGNTLIPTQKWSASAKLATRSASSRTIFTHDNTGNTVDFTSSSLSSSSSIPALGEDTATETQLINYLRGDQSNEQSAAAEADRLFRTRSSKLADFVHSRPVFVKIFGFGYPDDDYKTWRQTTAISSRDGAVYVGGNDGMLHGFDADDGSENFAFVPHTILGELANYADNAYAENHKYFVDGEMTIVDSKLSGAWSTTLVSPFGAGFKGLFSLDVTNPNAAASQIFQWEINENSSGYSDIGHIVNPPKIARLKIPKSGGGFDEKWVAITGNGVHSEDANDSDRIGKAVLYIIDLDNGALLHKITLDDGLLAGTPEYLSFNAANGITSVAAVDTDSDGYIERLYAGDLKGNLYRLNYAQDSATESNAATYISKNLTSAFQVSSIDTPIFQATGPKRPSSSAALGSATGSYQQAITGEITVTRGPSGVSNEGELVFFGTGKFFDSNHLLEKTNLLVQSMYAVWDKGSWGTTSNNSTLNRNNLEEQIIVASGASSGTERTYTNSSVDYTADVGWFMDLPTYGERIVRKPISVFEHISFISQVPTSNDVCVPGLDGWLMTARKDTGEELENSQGISLLGGEKQSGKPFQDPTFIQLSNGELVAPALDPANLAAGTAISSVLTIPQDFARSSWKRIQ